MGESAGYKTNVIRDMKEVREKDALRRKVDEEEHLEIYRGSREGMGTKTYLSGPVDAANI